ncbi:response regulator transcription factor [Halopseudomonas pachastrellae]|nr:response regulator transcription factor [Halopseudomonas pachastrellae]
MKNILILEDLKDAQRWLADAARRAWPDAEVQFYSTLRSACQALDERAPQLCLVDLQLPDGSGVDFIRQCRQQHPDAQLVVATMYDDDMHLFPALQAGANGYLLKEDPQEQIASALLGIVKGVPPLSPQIAQRMLGYFQQAPQGAAPELHRRGLPEVDNVERLSAREQEFFAGDRQWLQDGGSGRHAGR